MQSILKNESVENYLNYFKERFVIVPMDKASNNFTFVCKAYYNSSVLKEIGYSSSTGYNQVQTYEISAYSKEDIVTKSINLCKKLGLESKLTDKPIMY